jgi:hypothetical protein
VVDATRRLIAGLAGVAALAAAVANAQAPSTPAYVVKGHCRDGAPQGLYELRTPEGQLRVLGAFNHGRRTGSFIFWTSRGKRIAHIPFDDDEISGTVSLWYADAAPAQLQQRLEAVYVGKQLRDTRSWYGNGKPRAEFHYEDGVATSVRAWNAQGKPLSSKEAQALAARDRSADAQYLAKLFDVVHTNLPNCAANPPSTERAG